MDIESVRAKKKEVERKIKDLVIEFSESTGFRVYEINVVILQQFEVSTKRDFKWIYSDVKLDVRL